MDRIDTTTKAVGIFGAGKHGFKDGDLALGVLPTDFDAKWCNAQQEEKMSVIEGAGVVPAAGVFTQLRQALKRMFGGNVTTVNFAASPFALNADHAGLVLVDATAGNVVINLPAVNVIAQPLRFNFVRADATAYTATVNRAGADTFVGGATNFTLIGQGDNRAVEGDAVSKWAATSDSYVKSRLAALTVTVAANAMTGALPAENLDFRSTDLTSGVPVRRGAAAASLVVPNGAMLGTIAGQSARIVWGWIDNAGTPEPFVCNLSGGLNLDETTLISTTAISAAADSANVFYSTTARANVAFRVRGFCDISEAVAGTWATAPTLVQPVGGMALAALSTMGYDNMLDVSGGRTTGVTYYNLSGKPRWVFVGGGNSGGSGGFGVSITVTTPQGGVTSYQDYGNATNGAGNSYASVSALVPPGHAYQFAGSGLLNFTVNESQ